MSVVHLCTINLKTKIIVQEKVKWVFEPTHCKIGFSVRHFGISETEGFFRKFDGTIHTDKSDFSDARVELNIDASSIDTQEIDRDGHLQSPDFLNVTQYPIIHFKSTGLEPVSSGFYKMHGDLTILGITKLVTVDVEFGGVVEKDPFGNTKAGFFITSKINRKDFGITWNKALDFGGVAVGETVKLNCHIELLKSLIMTQKIWFITGISSGLGQALAEAVIQQGDLVAGSFRSQEQADIFTEQHQGRGLGVCLDIIQAKEVQSAIDVAVAKFGRLDVVVNNAGFGFAGAIEETSIEEARAVFEANFFGTLLVTQLVLPLLRKQKSGHIIQVSSHGGFKAFQGFGIYNASKFAVEGFSEALAQELLPLNVKVTIVEPGPFRTNFAAAAFQEAKLIIADYEGTAGAFRQRMKAVNGKQEGDPNKAAKAVIDISNMNQPPLRLPLGKIAVASISSKLDSVTEDLNNYKSIAESCVYD